MRRAVDERVVDIALSWLGTPFRHQGAERSVGCDCLGLVRGVWRTLYGSDLAVPVYRRDWLADGPHDSLVRGIAASFEPAGARPSAGGLIVLHVRRHLPPSHLAIVIGDGRMIHARERSGVAIASLTPWRGRIAGHFRFPERVAPSA
jgi:NlpC/P60 family putative phage cell wall peptidase